MVAFLRLHENFSLFLLGNFEAHGSKLTDAPHSGNFKIIRHGRELGAVFCLTRREILLVHSTVQEEIFPLILEACKQEKIPLKGLIGEWNFCSSLWTFLKKQQIITHETLISKEVLYSLETSTYPKEERVRLLIPTDYEEWAKLYKGYADELKAPDRLKEAQLQAQFLEQVKKQIIWGLFVEEQLVTTALLNAKAFDVGQVGGVYTVPSFRKQGLAKALMKQLVMDAKHLHGLRTLIIFTNEYNHSARAVYESLKGIRQVGYFALLFGEN